MVLRLVSTFAVAAFIYLDPFLFSLVRKVAFAAGPVAMDEDLAAGMSMDDDVIRYLIFILTLVFVCTPAPFIDGIPSVLENMLCLPKSFLLTSRSMTDRSDFYFVTELVQLNIQENESTTGDNVESEAPQIEEEHKLKQVSRAFWEKTLAKEFLGVEAAKRNDKTDHAKKNNATVPIFYEDPACEICTDKEMSLLVDSMQTTFRTGWSQPVAQRRRALLALRDLVSDNTEAIIAAAKEDLVRPRFETLLFECRLVVVHIERLLLGLDEWAKPKVNNSSGSSVGFGAEYRTQKDALGVVWILAATNFPFYAHHHPACWGTGRGKYSHCAAPTTSQ